MDKATIAPWTDETTVNDVVRLQPHTLSVFKSFGVDTCCGGALTLEQAAARAGVDLDTLRAALERAVSTP